jgi:hypothetical protein
MKKIILTLIATAALCGTAMAADLSTTNDADHQYGWIERERVCQGLTKEKCEERLKMQSTGAVGGDAATASSGGSTGGNGSTGPR